MIQLNRKHKAGLFLTLIALGIGLLLDADVNVVAGVAVLGVAASWPDVWPWRMQGNGECTHRPFQHDDFGRDVASTRTGF